MLDRLTWGVGLISRVDSFFSHGITLEESGYYKGHDICRTHSSGNSNRVMGHDLQNKRKFHSCRIGNTHWLEFLFVISSLPNTSLLLN